MTDFRALCAALVERIESDWEYDWKGNTTNVTPDDLDLVQRARAAMRPQPEPTLKDQALEAHERASFGRPGDRELIGRALEQLND
jgi:hypothetical protein